MILKHRLALAFVLVCSLVLWSGTAVFAAANDLIISEYGEGSSNNKYIEIYNGTGASIDLSTYAVWRISNGGSWPEATTALSGTLNDGQTLIVYNPSAVSTISSAGNLQISSGNISHNGNDAVGLAKNGTLIDAVGEATVADPVSWAVAGVANAMADHILVRKASVCAPSTNWAASSGTNATDSEWIVLNNEDWSNIGSHTANCGSSEPVVVINEIMQNPDAVLDSAGEWFELYNPTGSPIDINGWTIADNDIDEHIIDNGGPLLIPAGGYLVLGNNESSGINGGVTVDYQYPSDWFLSNGSDEVVLFDAALTEIDRVEYDNGATFPDPNGASMALSDSALDNNVGANWCTASTEYGNGDKGTPGAANDCDDTPPPSSNLVINEINADPDSTLGDANGDGTANFGTDEFVEIVNNDAADIDISGWTLSDEFGVRHTFPANTVVPANCSIVVFGGGTPTGAFGGSVIQTASTGSLGLNNGGDTVTINNGSADVVSTGYGGEGGDNQSLTRDPDISGTEPLVKHTTATGANGALFSPGTKINGDTFEGCPLVITDAKIHEVQGSGSIVTTSGYVKIEAIVVADYQNSDQLRGFFIQEEDGDADGDTNTSEGIFVFCGGCATAVSVGDLVQVTGPAEEFFGMSQIDITEPDSAVSVVSSGNALPTAATVDLPASSSTEAEATFENVEGMLVTFSDTLVVSEYFELARYGQLVLTADARPAQFTDANEPSPAGYAAFLADLDSKRIILDDDNNIQNDAISVGPDEPYFWPRPGLSNSNLIRGGDSISGLTGVMHWSFAGQSGTDAWRVRPVDEAFSYNFTSNNARTAAPEAIDGSLRVASFNVLNYFTTINSRGADSAAELDRQREKIAAAICAMDVDIVGLIEIENNGSVALNDLLNGANGINANCGPYNYINTGVIGTDEIAVAFIYNPATVSPVGSHAILDSTVDARFNTDKNRPALAQTFMDSATGGTMTVVVNHLKSKGSSCNDVGDPDLSDGAGNCNVTRTQAAAAMVDWLATDPTSSGDEDFLIIGDLNSYRNEDPIDAIEAGADDTASTSDDYTDLLDALIGSNAYSYVFDGQLGYLDYALANAGLFEEVSGVTVWHINADEIPVFDYNDEIDDGSAEASFERESAALPIYESNAYRASDHDPVIIGLDVCDEIAPTLSVSVTPDTLWSPNHKYVTVTATVVASDNFDQNPTITLIDVTSNEDDDGLGDGDKPNDIVIIDTYHVDLRAERAGNGNGRIYTLTYQVTDACGNSTTATATVTVPHNQ